MRTAANDRIFTVEEYIQNELTSERKHEFVNGQLFEMPGEKDINNEIAFAIALVLHRFLKDKGYTLYSHDMKVAIPGGSKYYYPDVFVTKEEKNDSNSYIKYNPEIIVEVVSESSQVTDYVDKYIDYTKIPSLHYYLIIEPETILITVYSRDENNNRVAHKYTRMEDIVKLEKFGFEFAVKDVY